MSPDISASKSRPLAYYEERVAAFSFESIAGHLSGDLRNGVNACVECCDRHVAPGRVALEWESADGRRAAYTFEQMRDLSARFANYLQSRCNRAASCRATQWRASRLARPNCS